MRSLGIAECHFILEETGGQGDRGRVSLAPSATLPCCFPATVPPLHRPPPGTERRPWASCKLLHNPQNPAQAFPCLGAFPDQSLL